MYKKLLALSTLCGTIIGVGLFGLPYVTTKVGFLPMIFYFIILGTVITIIHLMYGEISLRTAENHRLPGYSRIYLSRNVEILTYITTFIGLTGALLAYLIVGGEFLANLATPFFGGGALIYPLIFFILGALIIYFGSGPVSKTEFFSLGLFFAVLTILFFKVFPHINFEYFSAVNWNLKNFFLPYGVILFSIDGAVVIPEIKEILKDQKKSMKKIIILGTIIPIITYLIFIVTVFGVTGPQTTEEGMTGLFTALGSGTVYLGFLFGVLTTFTSFLTLGITLKKEFCYDCRLPHWLSWLLACLPALIFYLIGLKNFISIISFVGAVALGIDILIITLIYLKAKTKSQLKPAYSLNLPTYWIILMSVMFVSGVVFEIVKSIF